MVVYLSVNTSISLERNGIYKMECPARGREKGLTGTLVVGKKKRKVSRIFRTIPSYFLFLPRPMRKISKAHSKEGLKGACDRLYIPLHTNTHTIHYTHNREEEL